MKLRYTGYLNDGDHQGPQLQRKIAIVLKVTEEICLLLAFPNVKCKGTQQDFEEER